MRRNGKVSTSETTTNQKIRDAAVSYELNGEDIGAKYEDVASAKLIAMSTGAAKRR